MAATLKCDTLQNSSSSVANITLDTSGNATVANTLSMGSSFLRNRIINGDMRIDQRNSGAEVNPAVGGTYYVDRWQASSTAASKFKIGQNAGSVTPPTGFTNYLGTTSLSSYTAGAAEAFGVQQRIEGYNIADLAWGTASAKTVTLSFWVYSSLTGTFGVSVRNSSVDRSYVSTYSISAANTWEYKTIIIPGDTAGTWLTTTGIGATIYFALGAGSTFSTTAGSWATGNYVSATGAVSVVGTNAATFYITGVQFEQGSTATPFERRQYGQELALCQRYYYKSGPGAVGDRVGAGYAASTTLSDSLIPFPVTMRIAPTALEQTGTAGDYGVQQATGGTVCSAVPQFTIATQIAATVRLTVASGLTTGQGNFSRLQTTSGYFAWSAEL